MTNYVLYQLYLDKMDFFDEYNVMEYGYRMILAADLTYQQLTNCEV